MVSCRRREEGQEMTQHLKFCHAKRETGVQISRTHINAAWSCSPPIAIGREETGFPN